MCTAGWNTYGAMALPGSFLYKNAVEKKIKLPDTYEGYSFHSFETLPLPTEKLSAKEIITMRDNDFNRYHNHKPFLSLIEKKFGKNASKNIIEMTKIPNLVLMSMASPGYPPPGVPGGPPLFF